MTLSHFLLTPASQIKDSLKRNPDASDPSKRPSEFQMMLPGSYGWKDTDYAK